MTITRQYVNGRPCALLTPCTTRREGGHDGGPVGYLCIVECYVSKLMLRPNRAYNSTFRSFCSSLIVPSFSSNAATSSSIFAVDVDSISCTSGSGNETNESPILYLAVVSRPLRRGSWVTRATATYGIFSSSSASSSSFDTSSRSSFSFCSNNSVRHLLRSLRILPH